MPTSVGAKSESPAADAGAKRKSTRSEEESREIRLEQNRVAARESRKRKKKMVEDLQQSIIFYTRANGLLKQQNEYMQRLIAEKTGQQAFTLTNANAPANMTVPGSVAAAAAAMESATNVDTVSGIPTIADGTAPHSQLALDPSAVSAALASSAAGASAASAMQALLPPNVYAAVMHQMLQSQQQMSQASVGNTDGTEANAGTETSSDNVTELAAAAAAAAAVAQESK